MTIKEMVNFTLGYEVLIGECDKKLEESLLHEWEESKKLPRKKKKRVRKQLNLDWCLLHS